MKLHPIISRFGLCLLASAFVLSAPAQEKAAKKSGGAKPTPDIENGKYGPHTRNVFDLWKARSDSPTPFLVFIHGGGFSSGDKANLSAELLRKCLDAGISVASINYRLSPEFAFPAHFKDSARAIQFLRYKAKEFNLDPKRVAASGGSAGAGTSLWIGFHDDMADPGNDDPVLRQSTRLSCMAVMGAQSTYDPRVIKEWVGGRAHEHPALTGFYGLKQEELETPKAFKLYEAASAINHLGAGDPPVYMFYYEPKGPLPADARPGQGIHHINFGIHLKEKMDTLKIECVLRHQDDLRKEGGNMNDEIAAFLKKQFGAGKTR
jgi:acetyl esterase